MRIRFWDKNVKIVNSNIYYIKVVVEVDEISDIIINTDRRESFNSVF